MSSNLLNAAFILYNLNVFSLQSSIIFNSTQTGKNLMLPNQMFAKIVSAKSSSPQVMHAIYLALGNDG